jgi:hypothetical protein
MDLYITYFNTLASQNYQQIRTNLNNSEPITYDLFNETIELTLNLEPNPYLEDITIKIRDICMLLLNSNEYNQVQSLEDWKNQGYKQILKSKLIQIMDGKYKDQIALFNRWSGSTAYILIDNKKIAVHLGTLVRIL